MLSDKYWKKYVNVPRDPAFMEAENRRLAKQSECKHIHFSCRCADCGATLYSEVNRESEVRSHEQFL